MTDTAPTPSPSKEAMRGRALSILVHADTKVGKSTFTMTTPAPRLLIDAEAAHRFLPGKKIFWDPTKDAPPAYDGSWDTCVVVALNYKTVVKANEWLQSGQHNFRSVCLDSISEIQTKCKDEMKGGLDEDMNFKKWGKLLDHMEALVRNLRDLTEHPTNPVEAVVLTSMTTQRDGKWRPYVQGQLAVKMPYFLDVIGYMFVQEVTNPDDPTAEPEKMRRLLVSNHPQFEAGERVQGRLPAVVDNPNVMNMLDTVFSDHEKKEGN